MRDSFSWIYRQLPYPFGVDQTPVPLELVLHRTIRRLGDLREMFPPPVAATVVAWLGEHWVNSELFLFVVLWLPWPLLAAYAQAQRGGNVFHGLFVGLLFGPLGLLVANYSGGSQKK